MTEGKRPPQTVPDDDFWRAVRETRRAADGVSRASVMQSFREWASVAQADDAGTPRPKHEMVDSLVFRPPTRPASPISVVTLKVLLQAHLHSGIPVRALPAHATPSSGATSFEAETGAGSLWAFGEDEHGIWIRHEELRSDPHEVLLVLDAIGTTIDEVAPLRDERGTRFYLSTAALVVLTAHGGALALATKTE